MGCAMGQADCKLRIVGRADVAEVGDETIDPKLRAFLTAVRAGLLAVCAAIEKYLGK